MNLVGHLITHFEHYQHDEKLTQSLSPKQLLQFVKLIIGLMNPFEAIRYSQFVWHVLNSSQCAGYSGTRFALTLIDWHRSFFLVFTRQQHHFEPKKKMKKKQFTSENCQDVVTHRFETVDDSHMLTITNKHTHTHFECHQRWQAAKTCYNNNIYLISKLVSDSETTFPVHNKSC